MAAPKKSMSTKEKTQTNARKRQSDAPQDVDIDAAKKKKDEFTVIDFKFHLNDQNTVTSLEKFVEAAQSWLDGSGDDIVAALCRSSPECEEVLKLLESTGRKVSEFQPVFQCLEKILLRIADDLGRFYSTAQCIVRKILTSHSNLLHNILNIKNKSGSIKSGLKLLVSMVMLGNQSAKLVLNHVDLGHATMLPLLRRRDTKDDEDVRTCFQHLIVSFLLSGDSETIRRLIQVKGLMENVFQGIRFDRISSIQLMLSTVLEKVVVSPAISKTAKVHIFTDRTLKELALLFAWQGPAKWKESLGSKKKGEMDVTDMMPLDGSDEASQTAADTASMFLTELCTSYKHGIIFMDKTYGLSGRNQNHLMTSVLASLHPLCGQTIVQRLVTGILTACPDQIQYFLQHMAPTLSPRDTTKWVSSMGFLVKIYSDLQKEMTVLKIRDVKSPDQLVKILSIYALPTPQVLATVLPGIKSKSLVANYDLLGMVRQVLETTVTIVTALEQTTLYSPADRKQTSVLLKASVLKVMPEVTSMSACWDKVVAMEKSPDNSATDVQTLFDYCGVGLTEMLVLIEQVLCAYQDLSPTLMVEHPAILAKLLDGVLTRQSGTVSASDADHLTKVYLLKILAGTDARRLPWSRKNTSGHPLLYQLLEMVTALSVDSKLSQAMLSLVCKLLESTGQFDGHREELLLWLRTLQSHGSCVLDLVTKVMMTYIHNPYPYMDLLCDIQSKVAMDTDFAKTQQVNIDDVLKMDETELDVNVNTSGGTASDVRRFAFCPLVLVAVDVASKGENFSEGSKQYVTSVLLQTFHLQVDPRAFCHMMAQCGHGVLVEGFADYVGMWTKKVSTTVDANGNNIVQLMADELVSKGNLSLPGNSLKSDISRDLLHLWFIAQNLSKKAEKQSCKWVESCTASILAKIETALKTAFIDNVECHLPMESIFQPLETPKDSLSSCIRLVLNHPAIKQHFLTNTSESGNQSRKMSKVISKFVCDLLTIASPCGIIVKSDIGYYFQKTENMLESSGRSDIMGILVDILQVLCQSLAGEDCVKVVNLLLGNIGMEVGQFSKETFLAFKNLVCQILKKIMQSGLKVVKLKEAAFNTLIEVFLVFEKDYLVVLSELIENFPLLSVLCDVNIVNMLLSVEAEKKMECLKLLQLMMSHNVTLTLAVLKMAAKGKKVMDARSNLELVRTCLSLAKDSPSMKDIYDKAARKLMKILKTDFLQLCEIEQVENSDVLLHIFTMLHKRVVTGSKLVASMFEKLTELFRTGQEVQTHHIDLLPLLSNQSWLLSNQPETPGNQDVSVNGNEAECVEIAQQCVKCLTHELGRKRSVTGVSEKLLNILTKFNIDTFASWISTMPNCDQTWCNLLKFMLRDLYNHKEAMLLLNNLVSRMYRSDGPSFTIPIATVVDMVTSHSSFLPTMFGQNGLESKEMLIDLLTTVIELSPSSCHTDHVGVYLGAYGASMSQTDQKLLKLMQFYEKNDISLAIFKPYVWGEKAIELHALRKNLGPSLKQTNVSEVLAMIDTKLIQMSILNFPLRRKLQGQGICTADQLKTVESCYDPCFLLPLFSHFLEPASIVDCRKFTETGCLGYAMAALSSHDEDMRCAAMHVIDCYHGHLLVAKIPEKEQLVYFVDLLQNSLPIAKTKLASIITQFLARAAALMLRPDEHMYMVINSFLLLKPSLDIQNVPEFFKLFNSSAFQHKEEQGWILSLLVDGLRETADYRIFQKRFTFKLVQGFYDSSTADYQQQLQVLQLLMAACKERSVVIDLLQTHGFLVWLAGAINRLNPEKIQLVTMVIKLVGTLWTTLTGPPENQQPVSAVISTQVWVCLETLLRAIRDVGMSEKLTFTKTFMSVCSHLTDSKGHLTSSFHDATEHNIDQSQCNTGHVTEHSHNSNKVNSDQSHNATGHVTQTVSSSDMMLLLLYCQNEWTQLNISTSGLQKIFKILDLDHIVSRKVADDGKMRLPPAVERKTDEKLATSVEVDSGTTHDINDNGDEQNMEEGISKKSARTILEPLLKIAVFWLERTRADKSGQNANEFSSYAECLVDIIVVKWMLNSFIENQELHVSIVSKALDCIEKTFSNEIIASVLALQNKEATSIVEDMLTMYAQLQRPAQEFIDSMKNHDETKARRMGILALNKVLRKIYSANMVKRLINMAEVVSDEMQSVDIRRAFLQ
ncbi:nucleolar pre-ribosomal-associated protein 1-like isoform X2 [Dreissena polymorpha]|uniref:nucleolar pre-ribosomal-associated protein 1-like isoform X2 n=1 Tax=Dreissena polymorpha TaxID=45954 RepID=UPI0022647F15|nr:nucleolar pre-ribosomal-associated protein 1-like isoform X2 [Dreissena polymorpha]